MRRLLALLLVVGTAALVSSSTASAEAAAAVPTESVAQKGCIVLVSIDGLRWDYLDRYNPPALCKLSKEGFHAGQMTPTFPSKTFPNHFTIVTGLRSGNHGIINNDFLDPDTGRFFRLSDKVGSDDPMWWGGEPIWITARKQGQRSACMFWPGATVKFKGLQPNYFQPYDGNKPNAERVDQVLSWLALPADQRPSITTVYFSDVDSAGHAYGPEAEQTRDALYSIDAQIARLVEGIHQQGLDSVVTLIIVSDHGMSAISKERVVCLDDAIPAAELQPEFTGPIAGYRVAKDKIDATVLRLRSLPHVRVIPKTELAARHAFTENKRIPDIILLADDGWEMLSKNKLARMDWSKAGGDHGFDPTYGSMGAILLAKGPRIRPGSTMPIVENIHVYNFMCALLHLKPAANDGDERLSGILNAEGK